MKKKENTTDENRQFNNYIKLFKTQLSREFVSPYSAVPVETFPLNHKASCIYGSKASILFEKTGNITSTS